MINSETNETSALSALVFSGEMQSEAALLADFIFMAKDVSNAYLVTTADGDVLINTGFPTNAERNKALFSPHRTGPLRYIVLTQSHPDHYGGLDALREVDTRLIAERRFPETLAYYQRLAPFFGPRTAKLWPAAMDMAAPLKLPDRVEPDILVDRRFNMHVGERSFELISTPGGETLDSLTVWMPKEKVVFTGNLFGPVFMAVPNLNTTRGDKPRLVTRYLKSLEAVRDLGAEILITGHGEPIRGGGRIRADLDKLHAAVSYLNEETKSGMAAGKGLWALMRDVRLPEALQIGEFHGTVPWAVRSIWHEYAGWFLYESTTELYGTPRTSIDADLTALAGGADRLAELAASKLSADLPLESMHLLDIALGADPFNAAALQTKSATLKRLLVDGSGVNHSLTMWLRSEIGAVEACRAQLSGA